MIDIKDELRQYQDWFIYIKRLCDEMDKWENIATRVTKHLSYTSHIKGSTPSDAKEDYIEAIDRIGVIIKPQIISAVNKREELDKIVTMLTDVRLQNIIGYRYFNGLPWDKVKDKVFLSIQQTYNLHGQALEKLREILKIK